MDEKNKTHLYAAHKRLTSDVKTHKHTHTLKVRGWKKKFHANGSNKKAGVAILISDKVDLKTKSTTKLKEGHYIMIKRSIKKRILHSLTYMHPIQDHLNI